MKIINEEVYLEESEIEEICLGVREQVVYELEQTLNHWLPLSNHVESESTINGVTAYAFWDYLDETCGDDYHPGGYTKYIPTLSDINVNTDDRNQYELNRPQSDKIKEWFAAHPFMVAFAYDNDACCDPEVEIIEFTQR